MKYVLEAFASNWIAPLGHNVNIFEELLAERCQRQQCAVLSSGTSAIHLALIMLGIKPKDFVICQSLTFSASANPIKYLGATPVFVDSEPDTWNMDPELLEKAILGLRDGMKPKAIIVVHIYGMPAKMDDILAIGKKYDIPVIEDAAEALGSEYRGRPAGSMGLLSILSFNGNKIITTSGGGALLSNDEKLIKQARFLATQARDDAPHYQHTQTGYNYRMSNILAGIGRGQLEVLDERTEQRRANNRYYRKALAGIPGIRFQTEPDTDYFSNFWLTAIIIDPALTGGITREDIRLALCENNIEARPFWKPLHMQPVFADAPAFVNGFSKSIFENGLCLPSGSNLAESDLERVTDVIWKRFGMKRLYVPDFQSEQRKFQFSRNAKPETITDKSPSYSETAENIINNSRLFGFLRTFFKKYSLPRWAVFVQDICAVFVTFIAAYFLRFNFTTSSISFPTAFRNALITMAVYMAYSLIFKPYAGIIRHTTIRDVFNVLISTTLSLFTLILVTVIERQFGWGILFNIPLSILLIHYVCITALLLAARISIKMGFEMIVQPRRQKKNILIYGAGSMGVIAKQVIQNDRESGYHIAGFIDDSKTLQGKKISGIAIHSPKIITNGFLKKNNIKGLVFAIKEILPKQKAKIIRNALNVGLEVLETPSPESWINGQLQVKQLQKVRLEDLLGRDPIKLDLNMIEHGLTGKTILVTGAAGSIGSELVRQLARFPVKKLVLIDQSETPMFHLGLELKEKFPSLPLKMIIADVTNNDKMEIIFQSYHPEIVYHAAAYKHVPVMESNPHEAFRINVGGTRNLTRLAALHSVEKFVMISTDKAVNPTNIMGASKRLCEMVVKAKFQQPFVKTQFVITRFGNVLGSNGSVIPLFLKQIEKGGPVTVTHPLITRYFMTIPEACELVLEAGFLGKGGEIFEFDMGKPVRIDDLARQMIRLSGLVPDKDIQIEYTGLRPGEKLYEELLSNSEVTLPTHHPKIRIAKVDRIDRKTLLDRVDDMLQNLYTFSEQAVMEKVKEIVPEYICPEYVSPHENEKERQQMGSVPLPSR